MEHLRRDTGFRVERGVPGQMERDLTFQRRFSRGQCEGHFDEPLQGIQAAMRKATFQIGRERVCMGSGSFGDRHRPRYCPVSSRTAFRTPFTAKFQVLSV